MYVDPRHTKRNRENDPQTPNSSASPEKSNPEPLIPRSASAELLARPTRTQDEREMQKCLTPLTPQYPCLMYNAL